MDDERAKTIRAALDEIDCANVHGSQHEWLAAKAEWTGESTFYVRALLAERERLLSVAQNARRVAECLDNYKQLSPVLRDLHNYLWVALKALDELEGKA